MRFDLYPDKIVPKGGDIAFFDDALSDNVKAEQKEPSNTERAFVEAGLCDEGYLALISLEGVGAFKKRRHEERRSRENQSRGTVRSFNGIGMPGPDVLKAIRLARSV